MGEGAAGGEGGVGDAEAPTETEVGDAEAEAEADSGCGAVRTVLPRLLRPRLLRIIVSYYNVGTLRLL